MDKGIVNIDVTYERALKLHDYLCKNYNFDSLDELDFIMEVEKIFQVDLKDIVGI